MNKMALLLVVVTLGIGVESLADPAKQNTGDSIQHEIEAHQNTRRYQLTANSYSLDYYNNVISNVFLTFLKTYPQSPLCADVESTLKKWGAERDEVAKGSIKHSNRWYHGEEAKQMLAQLQTAQLIAEGDRQLQAGKYAVSAGCYKKVLDIKPLQIQTIDLVESKIQDLFSKWKSLNSDELGSKQDTLHQLQARVERNTKAIQQVERELALIKAAKFTGSRWVVYGPKGQVIRDFGSVLPDTKSLTAKANVTLLQNDITRSQAEIEKIQSSKETYNPDDRLRQISFWEQDCLRAIETAKNSLSVQETKKEIASAAKVHPEPATSTSNIVQMVESQAITISQALTPPPESQPVVAQAHDSVPESPPPQKQPWWKEFWYLLVIGIIGAIYILRH